ncbi:MAG TPA: hypothetical protein VFO55_13870 [Gemmatimonadaceae bacterium]|nr:hypothetical protein [Gemmatimonadaceae bacterium]
MTIGEWLHSREPRPPAELMTALEAALGPALNEDSASATAVFLTAAERMLRELVAAGAIGRPVAGDLLTIDALTTYSVEAATEALESLPDYAEDAMARFANIIQPGSGPTPPKP